MKEQTQMGMNRTGIQMSPFDTSDMQSGLKGHTPVTPGDDTALAQLRGEYAQDADPVGSVPIPGTVKGALTTGASMLTGKNPKLLLDKLGERLAFERTGTRLYDALITKFEALGGGPASMRMADLQSIREDEARHFKILAAAIESLGADPTAQTPAADIAGVEATGLMQVLSDSRTTIAQALHAILVAEMADHNAWEMLIRLAEDNGQQAMISDFTVALDEERTHLQMVQKWFEEATLGAAEEEAEPNAPARLH